MSKDKIHIGRGRKTLVQWLKSFKKNDGKVISKTFTSADIIYFICLTDGATGQLNFYPGMERKYSRDKYLLYITKEDRDNAAYHLLNNIAEVM